MPLFERTRIEVYIPDLPDPEYANIVAQLDREFTHAFGGCTIVRGLEGRYLSEAGQQISDTVSVIYMDIDLPLSTDYNRVSRYADYVRNDIDDALGKEEAVMIALFAVFHAG